MSLNDRQEQVHKWVTQHKIEYWKPLEIMARLSEESGELARELNSTYGPKKKKTNEEKGDIGDEIADIIFTLICLSNSLDIDLDLAFDKMMEKYQVRDTDRWEKK